MSQLVSTRRWERETAVSGWHDLYKISGVAAIIFVVYSLVTMVLLVTVGGPPETVQESFTMLQENRFIGLLRLDLLTLLIVPLYYVLFLGIYLALRKTNLAYATLGVLIALAGVTLFLATPSAFSWLILSDKFAAATTDIQRVQLLAAGEAILASDMWHGSGAVMGGLLMLVGALVLSGMMLRSDSFGKYTAYVGILTHALDLAHGIIGFLLPAIGIILMAVAGPLYLVWFPLLARDFFRLGRNHITES